MARCLAIARNTGVRCKTGAVQGRKFCRYHGGLTPVPGITHPAYKHGIYSSALPAHLQETAAQSASDPNILVLNEAIGALDARIVQLMRGLGDDQAGKRAWQEMRHLVEALEEYVDAENHLMIRRSFKSMYELLGSQFRESSIWDEIYSGFEIRRKLVETETKRREKAANMMGMDQAMVFMHQVAIAIRRHVLDPQILQAIALDLNMIAHKQNMPIGSQFDDDELPPTTARVA